MNKSELIAVVAEQTGLTKKDTERTFEQIIETITNTLVGGDKVVISGFGSWEVRDRAARTGRNPKTGEEIKIPAQKSPAFKAGKQLKEAVK